MMRPLRQIPSPFRTALAAVVMLAVLGVSGAPPLMASEDPVGRAMKLLEQRHYGAAAGQLRSAIASMDPARQGPAHLTLGMIYLRTAELHQALYDASVAVNADYLKRLSASRASRSRFVDLYLGELLLETGKHDQAVRALERFTKDAGVPAAQRAIGQVSLGLAVFKSGDRARAEGIWAAVKSDDPEVIATLAAAYLAAGRKDKDPAALADRAAAAAKRSRNGMSMRTLAGILPVYISSGRIGPALAIVADYDMKSWSYREVLSRSKIIHFYEYSLLRNLSDLYLRAAIEALEKATTDAKVKDTASFYLGAAYIQANDPEQSSKALASFIASPQMPQQFKDRAMARQAANQYERGRQMEAIGVWDELSRKQPLDPDLLAEILFACGRLRLDCPKVAQQASTAVETGEGKRFFTLNIALGQFYLLGKKKDATRAISYMESGRDKSNKNKIESNDPVMFVHLAGAYFQAKQFSEALEIYFEMAKQFPEVRQIQEAMQGIYAIEHKSAGDVKIF